MLVSDVISVTPQSAARRKFGAVWPSEFEPIRSRFGPALPFGVKTSTTSET